MTTCGSENALVRRVPDLRSLTYISAVQYVTYASKKIKCNLTALHFIISHAGAIAVQAL
jgi:hypothetical protein